MERRLRERGWLKPSAPVGGPVVVPIVPVVVPIVPMPVPVVPPRTQIPGLARVREVEEAKQIA